MHITSETSAPAQSSTQKLIILSGLAMLCTLPAGMFAPGVAVWQVILNADYRQKGFLTTGT